MSAATDSSIEMETLDDVSSESIEEMAKNLSEKYQASQQLQAYVFHEIFFIYFDLKEGVTVRSLSEELRPILKAYETGTNGSSKYMESNVKGEFANSFWTQVYRSPDIKQEHV